MSHILWTGRDEDDVNVVEAQLTQNFDIDRNKERWTLEMTEGPFSGYPAIYLNRLQLQELHKAIGEELCI
jgi:hypothetical protein